ncbi:hypothetical protein [Castellaniella sp.]|uniref:hypothetical protein n=1 Tax=Castellaniella sp. TaxID=1955812 RepID=UPI002AFF095C|nr:hypothetical protein [Castellaniella sp.]
MLTFTTAEADLLGRTADALCAYMGKPVIAEIITEPDEGFEWALFALPLGPNDEAEDLPHVQAGGPGARFLGNGGGLDLSDGQPVDCELLWAIQLSDLDGCRFIKVDAQGEEAGWSDELSELLPFELSEDHLPDDEDDTADIDEPDADDDIDPPEAGRTLH